MVFEGVVTDKKFDFRAVKGCEGQTDAVVRLRHTMYMAPKKACKMFEPCLYLKNHQKSS